MAGCERFINADLIAAGLSPLDPEGHLFAASRVFLREIREAIDREEDFSFETTLAGRSHLKLIRDLLEKGWEVELFYLALPNPELSRKRVAERVAHGGHSIPERDIERRFPRSLGNLFGDLGKAATRTRCFLNDRDIPLPVFDQTGEQIELLEENVYHQLLEHCQK